MAAGLKSLLNSVAARIAIIAVGPLLGLALTIGASLQADHQRRDSEEAFTALQARLAHVETFYNLLPVINSQVASFLELRDSDTATSVRQRLDEARKASEDIRAIDDKVIQDGIKSVTGMLEVFRTTFADLDRKVDAVGRSSEQGMTNELDRSTEMALALFEGATSLDERFRPLNQAFVEFRGAELRYRWKRDPKLENRVDFMRGTIMSRLAKVDFEPEQAKILHTAVVTQRDAFDAWKQGVQEEVYLSRAALSVLAELREEAIKLRSRAGALVNAERVHNQEVAQTASRLAMIAAAAAALIAIALIALVGRALSIALSDLANAMSRVAHGENDVAVPSRERRDEIGQMAQALIVFQESIAERARLASQSERDQHERLERSRQVEETVTAFASTIDAALSSLKGSAQAMDSASSRLDGDSKVLAEHAVMAGQATASASGEVNAVAASASQLTSSIEEVSRQAVRSTQVANNAVDQSRRASQVMQQLVEEASRIGDVVALIRSITEQTNLLALNATIEAARAGESGRGFAVVAAEVKALASQTARATEEIAAKVGGIQVASADAGDAIGTIDQILGEMSSIAASVAAAVEEQSSAINAISDNVNVAARNAQDGAQAIREAEERAQAGRHTASEVGHAARTVADQTVALEGRIDRFLRDVRAH